MTTATSTASDRLVEVTSCALCGSERGVVRLEEPPYTLRRCADCGLGYVSPRLTPEGLAAVYADDSYWRSGSPKTLGYHDYRSDQERYLRTFRKRLDHVLRDGPDGGRALDVGCAAGFGMAVLRERGFEVHGVEVSAAIAAHARHRLGFDTIHIGTLHDAPYSEASFDLITMWDVVEHVVDPGALLARARELLRPGGLLVLETQNIDSGFARLLGRRWHHYKHVEHIYHFTPSTVRRLLHASGFDVQRLTSRYGGKYVSLAFIAERAARVHPALSRVLTPLARLKAVSLYVNVRDEMVITARPSR